MLINLVKRPVRVSCLEWVYEYEVMKSSFLARELYGRKYLRFNEISKYSNIKKSTLQRIIMRLQKRGWIISRKTPSFSQEEPAMAKFHLQSLAIGHHIVKEIDDEYQTEKLKLKRYYGSLKVKDFSNFMYGRDQESYAEAVSKRGENITFPGLNAALDRAINRNLAKEHVFYQVYGFPFIDDIDPPHYRLWSYTTKIEGIPRGSKPFWYQSAKEVIAVLRTTRKI